MGETIKKLTDIGVTLRFIHDGCYIESKYFNYGGYGTAMNRVIEECIYIQESYILFDKLFYNCQLGNFISGGREFYIEDDYKFTDIYFKVGYFSEGRKNRYTEKKFSRDDLINYIQKSYPECIKSKTD